MKTKITLLIVLLSLYVVDTKAYTRLNPELHHFFSADVALGYASLLNNSEQVETGSGVAAHIGVGYRVLYNRFLFATGAELYYMYNAYSMSAAMLNLKMVDTEADPFTLHVDATAGRDWVSALNLNIPLFMGMEYRRFYFLAGPKLCINIANQMQAQATAITTATYDKYIEDFEDMPNHMLGQYDLSSGNQRAPWNIDVMAHVEIGGRIGSFSFDKGGDIVHPKHRIYLAAYMDYGLLNLNQVTVGDARIGYEQPSGQALRLYLTPALMSKDIVGAWVRQLSVGIKATVLLELPKRDKCVMCEL